MKSRLTDAVVKRTKPPTEGQVDIFDSGYPGLALRVSYGGRKTWSMFYRQHGRPRRLALGIYPVMSLAEARETWRRVRREVQSGRAPERALAGPTSFAAIAAEWLERDQAKNRSAKEAKRIIDKYVLPRWATVGFADVTRRDVRELIDGIVDRGTPAMARRVHARLHRLFAWAVGRDIIMMNPMTGLPRPGVDVHRDRVLTDTELARVWRAAEQMGWPYGQAFQILILTGARREEIGQLRWSEIEADQIRLSGERTKTGKPHMIPLSACAQAILAQMPVIAGSDYVFTLTGKSPIAEWSKAKRKIDELSDVTGWRTHDLRRTVATGLQRLGINLQTIEAVLGHTGGSRGGIVGVYQRHSFDAEKREALEAWGQHLTSIQ
jgi:integrase